ncbi:hypothetical protein [Methylocystis parvus]|uniref:hypothetical protein n=1 Tax=Methylocystis parvus TaxID=134 RepID=UPI0012F73C27|nr:hypothetical protein [Methylocystis parvus]WBJ98667.1 hypothetical protein MMG94_11615 [Methylocystis parvus OBBP]
MKDNVIGPKDSTLKETGLSENDNVGPMDSMFDDSSLSDKSSVFPFSTPSAASEAAGEQRRQRREKTASAIMKRLRWLIIRTAPEMFGGGFEVNFPKAVIMPLSPRTPSGD